MKRLGLGLLPLSVLAWALPAGADPLLELAELQEAEAVTATESAVAATAAISSSPPTDAETAPVVTTADSAAPEVREAVATADATMINVADIDTTAQPDTATTPALTVSDWLAQAADSAVAITAVQLQETAAGLNVILEADTAMTAGTARTVGNAQVIDIPNAVLELANANQAEQFAPAEGVALVSVAEQPGGGVQISITGTDAPPQINVGTAGGNLVLGVVPGLAVAGAGDSDAIQIGVEGEQAGSDYVVPNASTATRTDTPLRDIPQSIQVIPQAVLEDQGVIRLNDALRNVSGVVSGSLDQRGQSFIVRGFSGSTVLRDGVRLTPGGGNFGFQELSNIESIEVLKGPASVLYGNAEPGGTINIVTKQPLSEPFYEVSLRVGNRTLIEPSLDLTGPLTADGRLSYRLNALVRREDYYRDFDTPVSRSFIAPVVRWAISDRTDLTVSLEYDDSRRPADFGLPAIGDRVADVPFDRITGEPEDDARNETLRVGYNFEHRFSDNWRIRNTFSFYRFDPTFTAAGAVPGDFFGLPTAPGELIRGVSTTRQLRETTTLQTNVVGEFSTGSIEHTLLAGVDLEWQDFEQSSLQGNPQFFPLFNIFDPVYGGLPRPDSDAPLIPTNTGYSEFYGVYVQDQIKVFENLHVLAGLRYDTTFNETRLLTAGTTSELEESAFSPRLGVVYQPIEPISLYSSYSRSFVPNSGITADGDTLEPERGTQFEVGARAELLQGALVANVALFNITKSNVATSDPNQLPGSGFSVLTGEQRSQGIELDVIGEILPGWNIVANYAYTDADITEDNDGNEGNRLFGVPEHNVNLWTNYEIQDGNLAGLGFGLGFNYVSERFGDNENSFVLEDYFLTNAAISYRRDNWQAGLNFRNLFDIDYIDSSEGSRLAENRPGEGLTIIGSFSMEF